MKVLGQIVDTLKLHKYFKAETSAKEHFKYSQFVEELKKLKEEAMAIHHSNNDMRFVNYRIGSDTFRVMATTRSGFQVTIKNQDLEISFKVPQFAPPTTEKSENIDKKVTSHTHNPFAKVEFRASFLARAGHNLAVKYVNELFEKWIIGDYDIKVSEIHLATDLQGYSFTETDYFKFQTRKMSNAKHMEENEDNQKSIHYSGRTCTGFSFGKGDEMLRIYDKTVEIQKNPEKAFVKHLVWENNKDYDPHGKVWRIEVQYRREKLKTIFTKGQFLDGFECVLESLAELWGRALEVVTFKDLPYSHCLEMMTSYKMNYDDKTYICYMDLQGNKKEVLASSITKRYQRAALHQVWEVIAKWKGFNPEITEVHKAPKTSAFQWVANQIKGLFSTLFRYSGELSPNAFREAFKRTDLELYKKDKITLVDKAIINNIHYLDERRTFTDVNGALYPSDALLKHQIDLYVNETVLDLYKDERFSHERNALLTGKLELLEGVA